MSKKNLRIFSLFVMPILLIGIYFCGVSVKADNSYYDITIISSSSFDDLPDTVNATNSWGLNRATFGSILYNGNPVFFEVLSSSSSRNLIFYVSYQFLDMRYIDLIDDQFDCVSSDIEILQNAIVSEISNLGFINWNLSAVSFDFYTQLNYQNCIIHRDKLSSNVVATSSYEDYVSSYYSNFGPINSSYYQVDFISHIINFYDPESLGLSSYQSAYQSGYNVGVAMGSQDSAYYQSLYEQAQLTIDTLHEQLNDPTNYDNITFYNLLSNISMYPVNFFKEGLDVDIFGVNVGNVMLGIFMISITLSVVGIIKKFIGR